MEAEGETQSMIRLGRYDAFDKWALLCRHWAGETIDAGTDRSDRPSLPQWASEAIWGGSRACIDYIRLKCEGLELAASDRGNGGEPSALNVELARLLREVGYTELRERSLRFIEGIKAAGPVAACQELPPLLTDRLKETFKSGALQALRWTDEPGEIPNIEVLRSCGKPFPVAAANGKRNVLDLFCARFSGVLDVIHIHDCFPDHVTLVDFDEPSLAAMRLIYPADWTYVHARYQDFLREAAERGLEYDLIVADPWRGDCPEVGFEMLPAIMKLCSDTFVTHYVKEMFDELGVDREDLPALAPAIARRTGVDVAVADMLTRGADNCWLVLRQQK